MNFEETVLLHLERCVKLLIDGRYHDLEASGISGRLNAEQLADAIADYPGTITMPETQNFHGFHSYGEHTDGWRNIEYNLWFDSKCSDLTLSARIRGSGVDAQFEITDIHVL